LEEIEACIADQKNIEEEIEVRELACIIEVFFRHADYRKPRYLYAPLLVFRQLQGHSRVCRAFRKKYFCPADPYPRENEAILD